MARNRVRSEVAKGAEALRYVQANFAVAVVAGTFYEVIGPFEVDVDIMRVDVVSGAKPLANVANTLDIFNGTVAGAKTVMTQMTDALATYGWTAQSVQVPVQPPIIQANQRVPAGTPIVLRLVTGASHAGSPCDINVKIGFDIPVFDPNAKTTTYGGYDDGI